MIKPKKTHCFRLRGSLAVESDRRIGCIPVRFC